MDDLGTWLYIIAAIIYFIVRNNKKKNQKNTPTPSSQNRPQKTQPTKSFEELLKEITEGTFGESGNDDTQKKEQEDDHPEPKPAPAYTREINREGTTRSFSDEESKRVYEASVKMAEGADLDFAPDNDYKNPSLFEMYSKGKTSSIKTNKFAAEIRSGLQGKSAKKAIIYSEILNRKY